MNTPIIPMKSRREIFKPLAFRAAFVRQDEQGKSLITIDTAQLAVQYAQRGKNTVPMFRQDGVTFIGYDRRTLNQARVAEIKQQLLEGSPVRQAAGVHAKNSNRRPAPVKPQSK